MSIVPISDHHGTIATPFPSDVWEPFKNFPGGFPFSLDLWDPFTDFPFHFPSFSQEFFPSLGSQIKWKETPRAHVFQAFLPGLTKDEVVVYVDEDNMLQISSDDGKFMSRFKLPENALVDQVNASMNHGVLTVTVSKRNSTNQNVRVVEITGED
ncbi:18.1 kDa class I heat shock protein-like [Pistacia vera]|uniref:18.1 kDa class I heat shock protein-like n=1 Tax=Pistacia vera TaxID=55513 RepID=UPI0012632582|nr:18.1 kDa class I heat shock protein-like [Pistacia vera]XP_031285888.1 18.1 kDa class I heat shock protein-like [Pistacia vera]